jgi:hypothetical protein
VKYSTVYHFGLVRRKAHCLDCWLQGRNEKDERNEGRNKERHGKVRERKECHKGKRKERN